VKAMIPRLHLELSSNDGHTRPLVGGIRASLVGRQRRPGEGSQRDFDDSPSFSVSPTDIVVLVGYDGRRRAYLSELSHRADRQSETQTLRSSG
jgi:hypothetical protein